VSDYQRVIPRDLFNESKLLKCLGQLCLLIHDGDAGELKCYHATHPDAGFTISQRPEDGGLRCDNLYFTVRGVRVEFFTIYNSKDPYPLLFWNPDHMTEHEVFDDSGKLTKDFRYLVLGETNESDDDQN